jgi:hypothetical protein
MKSNKSFNIISDEIKRQYELQMKVDDSHDTKIGIALGFILVVLAQITLSNQFTDLILNNKASMVVFSLGIFGLLYSGYAGIRAYFIRKYHLGPRVSDLIEQYRNGEKRDYDKVIARNIHDAFIENSIISQNKAKYIKKMFILFFVSFIFIIISKIITLVS